MKIAIFGDVHANLEGLEACLEHADAQGCNAHCCIGDVVGYNADPKECIERIQALDCPIVQGNHDEMACSEYDLEGINYLAYIALMWTRDCLSDTEKEWLRNLRLVRQISNCTLVHATLDTTTPWWYVRSRFDAMASMNFQFTRVCFYGHTHLPGAFIKDETVRLDQSPKISIEEGKKYFINCGSAGQPRDGNWQASYVLYDVENCCVHFHRVPYDIEKTRSKIISAGLPRELADRLRLGR